MKIRQIQAFKAVMLTGTETQAAELLSISQPAVSRLISNLEQDVGFPVFNRRNGRVYPTPEASYLYDEAEKTLSSLDKLGQTAKDIRDLKLGQLRVACMPALSLTLLPKVVATFLAKRPKVTVSLHTRSSQKVKEWVATRQFDIGIAELPADDPALDTDPLNLKCVCVLPKGHPLERKTTVTPNDLDGVPFVSLHREHMTFFRIESAFEAAKAKRNIVIETSLFAPACSLVAQGAGVSIVDPITAGEYLQRGIVARPFKPSIPFDFAVLYPAKHPQPLLVSHFVRVLKGSLKNYISHRSGR